MSMSRKLQYQILGGKRRVRQTAFIGLKELDSEKARLVFRERTVRTASRHSDSILERVKMFFM